MDLFRLGRLSPDVLGALAAAGWTPERKIDIKGWVEPLEAEGYRLHPLAEEVLARVGGLTIDPIRECGPNFANDEPYSFDPLAAGVGQRALAAEIEDLLGGQYFPVGEWLSYSSVFVEAGGRVVAAGMGWIWELGATFEESLQLAIGADRPLVCLHADDGLEPWPPTNLKSC
ncbi:SUKH-3 domain-containing protein [Nocardioides sp. NPDC087217]|uniref:SUKH-3 domain-containing protein n=1 Tax=Nocardioides sp. NPDC087217 TaxID=3364335 RepID=UPI00380032BC